MPFQLGPRSRKNLVGVHTDLVRVVELAIARTPIDFVVIEGLRTLERQRELVAMGASRTLLSRHLTGHAVDLAAIFEGRISWRAELYRTLAPWVKAAAAELAVPIEWGGDWRRFVDMPHWQLPARVYPA
jgi:peptidoglycan L-alanyl-D-glutamate endopeptidase CwlK